MRVNSEYHELFNRTIMQVFGRNPINSEKSFQNLESMDIEHGNKRLETFFIRLGDTYLCLKKHKKATNCYHEAFKFNPSSFLAFSRLILLNSHFNWEYMPHKRESELEIIIKHQVENDLFRQTLIEGYILLSRKINAIPADGKNYLLDMVRNLDTDYFQTQGGVMRDHGFIDFDGRTYAWMINHIDYLPNNDETSIPVMILTDSDEYASLHSLINEAAPSEECKS